MLDFHLVSVILEEPEVHGELVGLLRGRDASLAYRPVIPIEFPNATPGVTAGVGREIVGRVSEKPQAEKTLARVDVKRVDIEEIQDAEVAGGKDKSPAVVMGSQLQWDLNPPRCSCRRVRRLLEE